VSDGFGVAGGFGCGATGGFVPALEGGDSFTDVDGRLTAGLRAGGVDRT
jgi:hypothetical protein